VAYIPTKRCDNPKKHEPHPWKQNKVFKRECPGRTTDKLNTRRNRPGHPRNGDSRQ
jgi:hypothetical protein